MIGDGPQRARLEALAGHDAMILFAGALSDVDALLGGLDQLIAKKRDLKQAALDLGFVQVESGPLVRSSYHANETADAYERVASIRS